jgi:hypothetical protein
MSSSAQILILVATLLQSQPPQIDRDKLGGIEDREPVRSFEQNYDEARSYDYLLLTAHKTDQSAFAKSGRRDLTYAHLLEEPVKYRGAIVHVEGRMRRLRQFDATRLAAKEGVPVLYEGWVFPDGNFGNPYCIITSELPDGMKIGEKVDYKVTFDGYFFKVYRYKAGDANRIAPLLIGRGLQLIETSPIATQPETDEFGGLFTVPLLGVLASTVLLALGMGWWYRRGDRTVRARLNQARNSDFSVPEADAANAIADRSGLGEQN